MKHILRLATTLALVLGIVATDFAVVKTNTKLKPVNTMEKQITKRKHNKYRRHSSKKIGSKRRISVRRTYRLTERQRRYYNQRLLNIFIN